MSEWWNALSLFQQIMILIASPATIIIIIQMIMTIFGFSNDDSFDTSDTDTDIADITADTANSESFFNFGGLRILSVRSILAFLCVGGWLAMALSYTMPEVWASIIGVAAGAGVAFLIAFALHSAMKLQSSGNIDYKNAVSHTATVYIRIPPDKKGKGKVNLIVQERFVEIDAVTEDNEYIETGLPVKVTALEDENTVIVKRL